jgi:EmrB/QacA subfamily drug resistance transporter
VPTKNARSILAATVLGSSLVFIDSTAVSVALPVFQRDLHADLAAVQWIVEAYQLFLSALVLVGGSLGDHYGRRRVFAIGVAAFAVASCWCGLSPTSLQMIIARSVQGIAGALLVPSSLAIISASFGSDRGRAIGTWSALTSLNLAFGPVLGGWIVQHLSWRWVFFINVPVAAVVLLLIFTRVPESRDSSARALDPIGAVLITLSLGAIVYGLIESQAVTGVAGLVLLVVFIAYEARVKEPLVPLKLFRSRLFSACNLLTLLLYAALGGSFFFLPFNLIHIQHYTPTQAGAANLPTVVMMVLLSKYAGALSDRIGVRMPLIFGPLIAACGFALMARPSIGGSYWTTFFPAMFLLGTGMALTVAPLTTAVMSAAGEHSGIASGISNSVARTAGLIAVAILGVVFAWRFTHELEVRVVAPPAIKQAILAQSARMDDIVAPPEAKPQIAGAFVGAFRVTMLTCAGLALASSIVAMLWVDPRRDQPSRA